MSKLNKRGGFTLAELLIVIAIMAILIAIAIPVFSAQLENARHAVDDSAERSAMSMAESHYLLCHAQDARINATTKMKVGFKQNADNNMTIYTCSMGTDSTDFADSKSTCTLKTTDTISEPETEVTSKCTDTPGSSGAKAADGGNGKDTKLYAEVSAGGFVTAGWK